MMLLPWRSNARARFSTSNAVSVPSRDMRRASCSSYCVALSIFRNSGSKLLRAANQKLYARGITSRVWGGHSCPPTAGKWLTPKFEGRFRISPALTKRAWNRRTGVSAPRGLLRLVIHTDLCDVRSIPAPLKHQPYAPRRGAGNRVNRHGRRNTTCREIGPSITIPALKFVAPDATLFVIIPAADGLDEADNVETLFSCQVHLQPA